MGHLRFLTFPNFSMVMRVSVKTWNRSMRTALRVSTYHWMIPCIELETIPAAGIVAKASHRSPNCLPHESMNPNSWMSSPLIPVQLQWNLPRQKPIALLCFSGSSLVFLASHLFPAESIHSVFTRYFCVPDLCCNARQHNQILKYMRPHHTVHYNNTNHYMYIYIVYIYITIINICNTLQQYLLKHPSHLFLYPVVYSLLVSTHNQYTASRRMYWSTPTKATVLPHGTSWNVLVLLNISENMATLLHNYFYFYPPISWWMFMVHHVPMNLHIFPIERWSSPMTHGPVRPSRAWMSSVPRPIISTVRWMARTCRSSRLPGR